MASPQSPELPDPPLTTEEQKLVALLTTAQIADIDQALLSKADHHWRKVAFIVGSTMSALSGRVAGIPDTFYSQRVRRLVEGGFLESVGNLAYMRFSEVRKPKSPSSQDVT